MAPLALPAVLLAAIRGAAVLGRGAAVSSGRSAAIGKAKKLFESGLQNMFMQSPAASRAPISSGSFPATRETFTQAAKHFGTANPSSGQMRDFQQQQQQTNANQEMKRFGVSLGTATKTGLTLAAMYGTSRLALRDFTRGVEESAERMRLFNPAIGRAAAILDSTKLRLLYKEGRETGATTAALLQSRAQRLEAAQPFQSAFGNLSNVANIALSRLTTSVIGYLDKIGIDEAIDMAAKGLAMILRIDLEEMERRARERDQHLAKFFFNDIAKMPESLTPDEMERRGRR